jgi:hypothetical protein
MTQVEMISEFQEHEFVEAFFELGSEEHFWFRWRFEAFLKQARQVGVPLDEPLSVLDIGAGRGVLRQQIERATEWTVDITDLDHRALESSDAARGTTYYYDVLEKKAEWKGKYDVLLLFDVLEHIENTRPFLDAVLYHLKDDGYLFLNVPALPILFSRFDEVQGHHRRYTVKTLKREFDDLPVELKDMRYWGLVNIPTLLVRRFLLSQFSKGKTDDEIYRRGFALPGKMVNDVFLGIMKAELALPAQQVAGSAILAAVQRTAGQGLVSSN